MVMCCSSCEENWYGVNCSVFICEEQEDVCGGGICVQHPDNGSQYLCACPLGVLGNNCEYTAHAGELLVDCHSDAISQFSVLH